MADVTPQSVANMDGNFETRLREAQTGSLAEYVARSQGLQVKWQRPLGWSGDAFDPEGMAVPFDREQANAEAVQAMSGDPPGTVGDVVVATTQIDYLSTMERAFHMRFMRRPRAMAHMLGRKAGHGSQLGPFIQCGVEYVRSMLRQGKKA